MKSKKMALVSKDCVACGSCVKVCPRDAISVPWGVSAIVDPAKCVGCGKCAFICPAAVITLHEREASL
ncbi:MAG: ATP-binding protein [Intestinibacillus sp.]